MSLENASCPDLSRALSRIPSLGHSLWASAERQGRGVVGARAPRSLFGVWERLHYLSLCLLPGGDSGGQEGHRWCCWSLGQKAGGNGQRQLSRWTAWGLPHLSQAFPAEAWCSARRWGEMGVTQFLPSWGPLTTFVTLGRLLNLSEPVSSAYRNVMGIK